MDHEIPVEAFMDIPGGGDELGRDPRRDDAREFDHAGYPVVGHCTRCGREIHDGVTGHGCTDGFRDHPDGEDIELVDGTPTYRTDGSGSPDPGDDAGDDTGEVYGDHYSDAEIERIRTAFDDVPRVPATEIAEYVASRDYPPPVVPETGPVPDPHHEHRTGVTIEVPEWLIFSLEWQIRDRDEVDADDLGDIIIDMVHVDPTYVTPDGEDLVDAFLNGRDG